VTYPTECGGFGIPGPAGPTGPTGPAGPAGPTGATGPAGPTGATGPAGQSGSFTNSWSGSWESENTYAEGDLVQFGGSTYVATADPTPGVPPPDFPWDLVAQQGTAGAAGAAGATGATGPAGAAGAAGTPGTVWTTGTGAPSGSANTGDMYLDTVTGDIYTYSGSWALTGNLTALTPPWFFDVTQYGAKADVKVIPDGTITASSTTLTSASGGFAGAVAGMSILVNRAGASGVTAHTTTIAAVASANSITLTAPAVTTATGVPVFFGTDDTVACNAAIDAAEAYLAAGNTHAEVFTPRFCALAGALRTNKSGNGLLVFGPNPVASVKKHLTFSGPSNGGAAVRHWQQQVPQMAGGGYIAFRVFASTAAQIASINASGNPAIICGPNEGSGYGVGAVYANIIPVIKNLTLLNAHSDHGLTYGALNLWGCANAQIENVSVGTAGVVTGADYVSPTLLGTGLSIGVMLPAPGNNDLVYVTNLSVQGGYTYAMFLTEHGIVDRYMALYCWAGLVPVGSYAGSVGSVHAMKVISMSVEQCVNQVYIYGVGSTGVGPMIDIDQCSTEAANFTISGTSTAAVAAARGTIRLTGLFTEANVTATSATGLKVINGQLSRIVRTITASTTIRLIDETVLVNAASGPVTLTLISAVATPNQYTIKKIDSSANVVTVAAAGGQTIDGSPTATLPDQWNRLTLAPDGVGNWTLV